MRTLIRRRAAATALAVVTALALAGCVKLEAQNTYHADGTIDMMVLTALDKSLAGEGGVAEGDAADLTAEMEADPEFQALKEELGDKISVEPYDQDNMVGFRLTVKGATPEEIERLNESQGETEGNTTVVIDGGTITVTVEGATAGTGSLGDTGDLSEMGIEESMFDDIFDISVRHTFPGPVESTTIGKVDPDDPNTVVIDSYAELTGAGSYTIVAKTGGGSDSGLPWLIIGIIALVVIAVAVVVIVLVTRRKAAAPASAIPGISDGDVPPPPAPPAPPAPQAPPAPPAPPASE